MSIPFVFQENLVKNISRSVTSPNWILASKWVLYGPPTLIMSNSLGILTIDFGNTLTLEGQSGPSMGKFLQC